MLESPSLVIGGVAIFFTAVEVKRRLVLLGAPGSGKGTQAEMITRQFGIPVTSPGAILRREKDLGTPLGLETAEITQRGDLVPDKIIINLIEDWLRLHGGHGFVFDGFPRTLPQAESLASILTSLRTSLDARDLAGSIRRNGARTNLRPSSMPELRFHDQCDQRASSPSARSVHIATGRWCAGMMTTSACCKSGSSEFKTKTQPLADFYGKMSILRRIDGNRDRETVFSDISRLIEEKVPA